MPDRDPRREPQPGDELRDGSMRFLVTNVNTRAVCYDLTEPSHKSMMYRLPMKCRQSLREWRKRMKDAEVLEHA